MANALVSWLQLVPASTLSAAAGGFSVVGNAATLSYTTSQVQISWLQLASNSSAIVLTAAPGAFNTVGVAATLFKSGTGQVQISWLQAQIFVPPVSTILVAAAGGFVITGAPSLALHSLSALPGNFSLRGVAAALRAPTVPTIAPTQRTLVVEAEDRTLNIRAEI